jgi:putative transposase
VAESFFATLETEVIDPLPNERWETRAQARSGVFSFIEAWYNPKRWHSTLGYLSPAQYEAELLAEVA